MATNLPKDPLTGLPVSTKPMEFSTQSGGLINRGLASTNSTGGFGGVQSGVAPAPAPKPPAAAPAPYEMGTDGQYKLDGQYLADIGTGKVKDNRVAGFSPGPGTILARNDQGKLVTNALRVGSGSAARGKGIIQSQAEAGFSGVQGSGAPTPAPAPQAPAPAPSQQVTGSNPATHRGGTYNNFGNGATASGGRLGDAATMQQHWNQYWDNFAVGSNVPFAGGTLTRNQDGTATFKNAAGKTYTYNKNTPFAAVAANAPEIAALWKQDFGYGASAAPAPVNDGQFRDWEVTPEQTVQQQALDIIAKDSPLMQQARGRAMQQMNERGLINSSIGIQAAQDAVMDRALQIAQPDAATNAQAAQFNANQGNAWNLAQQEMDYKRWSLMQNFENQKQLNEIESKYSEQLNSDANFQKQYSMYLDALFQIDMNPDLDERTKLQMKKQRGQELDDYVTINKLGINMDFSDYWDKKMAAAPAPTPAPAPGPDMGRTYG